MADIQVGCGLAKGDDSTAVGMEAAMQAMANLSECSPSVVLVFASVRYELNELLKGIHTIVTDVPLIGVTTAGEIFNGPQSGSVVVAVLASPYLKVKVGVGEKVSEDWQKAVDQAVNTPELFPFFSSEDNSIWKDLTRQGKTAFGLLFSPGDTRRTDSYSYAILERLKRLSRSRLPIFGGSAADDWRMEANYVLYGEKAYPDSLLVAVFETGLEFGTAMAHGFCPGPEKSTVTRSKGLEVLELDGQPAADVFARLLGSSREGLEGKHLTTISGRPVGSPDPYGQYSISAATYLTPEGGVRLTQPLIEGTALTLMQMQPGNLIMAGQAALRKALLRGNIGEPAIVFVFSCASRQKLLGKRVSEEISGMTEILPRVPIVGFYCLGEQGLFDDGANHHNNEVISVLALGRESSYAIKVGLENEQLRKELEVRIAELRRAEHALQKANDDLAQRVGAGTAELKAANDNLLSEINERKKVEEALRESESHVKKKLDAILSPNGDIGSLEFSDIIDKATFQTLIGDFYRLTGMGISMIDNRGKILAAFGWQEICTKFHRVHPETCKGCGESDIHLSKGVALGEYKVYRCKNNMWDIVTPIVVGGNHIGNFFSGQFFFEDESPDYKIFVRQARQYGFDEQEYLSALDRVPRWSRKKVDEVMTFYTRIAGILSSLSYSNIKLARTLSEKDGLVNRLQQSEQKFRTLLENAGEAILVIQNGMVKFCNVKIEEISGCTREEIMSRHFIELVHAGDREMVLDRHTKRLQGMQVTSDYILRIMTKTGDSRWTEVHVNMINWEGKAAILVFLVDITERIRMEEEREKLQARFLQSQKMESVGRLAGGVAHDFNNMLGVIHGYAEMAAMEIDTEDPAHDYLKEILKAAQRSAELTRKLLAFARKQTVSPQVLDLNDTVAGMLKMLQRLIGEDIYLAWIPGHNLWKVMIDPSQVDQVLANLAVNARDAINGVGKIIIETANVLLDEEYCAVHRGCAPGEYVKLVVSDNGCGMDGETLSHIFEPFFTTKGVGVGTGLGLATVYGIVNQNQGYIDVYSEREKGTVFRIYLPRFTAEPAEVVAQSVKEKPLGGTETVLMVEDEEAILILGKAILEGLGYTVMTANTPGQALRLAREHTGDIHLLITDVVMPEIDGGRLAERLGSIKPEMKCLFMSGYTSDAISHHGILDEGLNFIQKPFPLKALAEKVREILDK